MVQRTPRRFQSCAILIIVDRDNAHESMPSVLERPVAVAVAVREREREREIEIERKKEKMHIRARE